MNKKTKQLKCFRCQESLDILELRPGKGLASQCKYCDHCYDNMFVSWREAYGRLNLKNTL